MCASRNAFARGRRTFLALAAAGLYSATARAVGPPPTPRVGAAQALERLKAGNAAYVKAPALCATRLLEQRAQQAAHQAPWATVLCCADSRVPPELVFGGLGLGQLFVARNAGHVPDDATLGTLEYACSMLGVALVVVLGHERCGAVTAAAAMVRDGARFPGFIGPLVEAIVPAARAVADQPGDFVDNAVRENARRTARDIATRSESIARGVAEGKVRVVAARYDLDSGRVEFL
ncbi:carbonic anhydrase [Comamonas endophytica]|uniref:carbonic anhydrase n=1 Tax=Comamonas endophytica TaxID=2949090 RepID=A0ABY6G8V8_9BURK|nr:MULTISPECIES: carbonic anhydrase [unclassified Acidovorax]MCD2511635.1 carbonic anhydrase [Acidovorax sp. D4N7]UYG51017.1 carbonic anhydrase [Acidovorax sp. 5MLIR]